MIPIDKKPTASFQYKALPIIAQTSLKIKPQIKIKEGDKNFLPLIKYEMIANITKIKNKAIRAIIQTSLTKSQRSNLEYIFEQNNLFLTTKIRQVLFYQAHDREEKHLFC